MQLLAPQQGVAECSGEVSSVKVGSRRCKSHREGNEGRKPDEIWSRAWKGAHLSLFERKKGEEGFQHEMLLMWKFQQYG